MRILLVSRGFNKHGGISRYVAELAEKFVREHEIHLLTTKYDYKVENLIVHKKPMIEKPLWLQISSNAYYNTKYTKKLKEKFNIDIVHSNGSESLFCDVLTMHSCHKAWVKYYRSWDLFRNVAGFISPVNKVVLSVERKVIEKGSKKIIAVSEGVKMEILENYNVPEDKIVVIPNGVDLDEFKPDKVKRRKIREMHGIADDEIVLMFSGYEFRRKGLEYIIKALPQVKEEVKLLVVGKDNPEPYKKLASKLGVSNKIIFAGFVPDIREYYAASDVFVFPTLYEPFGLVITEALASGLPVIVSEFAGATDIMNDGREGLLLKNPTNPKEIAEKVNILVEDENLRKQMSRNARKTAEKYSWDIITEKTLKVYEDLRK